MMNKNLLLAIFGNVAPEGKIIKYISSEVVSGGWVDNNTDTNRNTFVNGEGTLYLNDGVTSIGGSNSTDNSPFFNRTDVTSVDLKYSGLIYINSGAFYNCNSLTSVIIPNSVTTIGKNAFRGCSSLATITIPDSVTGIGSYAFADCTNLKIVTCLAIELPTLGTNNFTAENDTLYVPSESVSTYQSNDKWSTAFTTITAINN
jgi:hypothetical protein